MQAIDDKELQALMEEHGFEKPDTEVKPRIIMSVEALDKQGKTHFALTAPGPVALFNLDIGLEGVIQKFADKQVIAYNLEVPTLNKSAQTEATQVLEKFKKANMACLRSKSIRTIIYDTSTEIWEIYRLAMLGKLTQIKPHHYVEVNQEYRKLIRNAYASNKNVIMLHKLKAEWIDNQKTGNYERSGFSDTGFLVQVNARISRMPNKKNDTTPRHTLSILNCRQNPSLQGFEFEEDMCDFPIVASMVIEGTTPDQWE